MASRPDASGTPDEKPKPRRRNKREEVIMKAADLMARHGFDGTSMRDIAAAVDMLPGSLYYHFPSKEDMLLAIHERVVANMTKRVEAAVAAGTEPWERIENAAVAHLEGLLETGNMVSIISPNFAEEREELNDKLKAHRNAYEMIFKELFDALDLPDDVNRGLLRLQLFGALNWVPVWYRPDREPDRGASPEEIARSFVQSLRSGCHRR